MRNKKITDEICLRCYYFKEGCLGYEKETYCFLESRRGQIKK